MDDANDGGDADRHEDGQRDVFDPHDAAGVLVPGGQQVGAQRRVGRVRQGGEGSKDHVGEQGPERQGLRLLLGLLDLLGRGQGALLRVRISFIGETSALGGTLEQHIEGAHGTHTNNRILSDHRFIRHSVRVGGGTNLECALAPVLTDSELIISSAHHQRVARVGEGLQVSAYAPDGTIEAIETIDAPVIGVQWHPEDPAADISQLRALLGHLDARRAPRLERASTTLVA